MADAITNTSPLLYLHRTGLLDLLPELFEEVWTPSAVVSELSEGRRRGHDVPVPASLPWLVIKEPRAGQSDWLPRDLGHGETAALELALEHPDRIILLDDLLARRIAETAGLQVWGTLRILVEAKKIGRLDRLEPVITRLSKSGMWISPGVRGRILTLAGEIEE